MFYKMQKHSYQFLYILFTSKYLNNIYSCNIVVENNNNDNKIYTYN